MTKEQELKMEKGLVKEFMETFHKTFKYYPTVVTKNNTMHNEDDLKIVSLEQLQSYFEPFLPMYYGKKLKISSRNRTREMVEIRFVYYFMSRAMGYNLMTIAKSLNMDHSSVVHGLTTFKNLYETSDPFRQKYIKIINTIKEKYESSVMDNITKMEPKS